MPEIFRPPPWNEEYSGWSRETALQTIGRDVPYRYGETYFPHDIRVREWGAGARSRAESAMALGIKNIRKGAAANPHDRIEAVRRVLPLVRFNMTPRVEVGLKRLRQYKRKMNEALGIYLGPHKDGNDHAADAFGEWAVNSALLPPDTTPKPDPIKELMKPRTMAEVFGNIEDDNDE